MNDMDEFEVDYVTGLESLLREYMEMPDNMPMAEYQYLRQRALSHLGDEEGE